MATSNPIKTSNDNIMYEIDVTETATSTSDNTSTITVNVNAWSIKDGYSLDYEGECYLKIDGVSKTLSSWSRTQKPIIYGYANKVNIYTGSFTILHNTDGTKSIQVASCFELYFDGYVKLTSSFKSINIGLTSFDTQESILYTVYPLYLSSSITNNLYINATVYNTNYTHELVLSDTGTTITTISNLSLVNGENRVLMSASNKNDIRTYITANYSISPINCKYTLITYSGQNVVGSQSVCYGYIRFSPSNSASNKIISVRSTGVTVNGDVNCTKLTQTTPNMEVNNGVLKILRW